VTGTLMALGLTLWVCAMARLYEPMVEAGGR
jgi:hypothetical protein